MLETTGPSITALMRAPSTESRGRINVFITCEDEKVTRMTSTEEKQNNRQQTESDSRQLRAQRVQRCSRNASSTEFYRPTNSEETRDIFKVLLLRTILKIHPLEIQQPHTLVKVFVMRDWMLLVVVLKVLQLWAMRRAAKSRRAQWLSTSGRKQSCLLTMHVTTAGMSSCSYKHRQRRRVRLQGSINI